MVGLFCSLFERDPDMFRFLLLVQHGQLERVTTEMQTPVTVLKGVIEAAVARGEIPHQNAQVATAMVLGRSEEHTSELQSLMRISYAVFCLQKKTHKEANATHGA